MVNTSEQFFHSLPFGVTKENSELNYTDKYWKKKINNKPLRDLDFPSVCCIILLQSHSSKEKKTLNISVSDVERLCVTFMCICGTTCPSMSGK